MLIIRYREFCCGHVISIRLFSSKLKCLSCGSGGGSGSSSCYCCCCCCFGAESALTPYLVSACFCLLFNCALSVYLYVYIGVFRY
jgi:hypothetical protein